MTTDRRIRLNGFKASTPAHTTAGLWRHPDSQAHRYRELDFWIETARTLERGGFDSLFVADALGVLDVYRGDASQTLLEGLQTPTDDPMLAVSAMAAATERLGFGITVSSTYELPYQFARSMTTLDHLTEGRIGWNVVTSALDSAAQNLGLAEQLRVEDRYAVADEFMDVVYQLWEGSWEDDAVVRDRARGIYSNPSKVHPIEHHGRYFDVPGIFLSEPSAQRTPVIYQAGTSPSGLAFAARHAEGVFMSGQRPDILRPRVDDLRRRAAALGRDPRSIKVVAIMTVVTAPTDAEARAKFDDYRRYASIEGNLARLSGIVQIDLSQHDLDAPLRYEDSPGIRSILANFTDADGEREWTPRQVAEHMAVSSFGPVVVGSPETVANELERWVDEADIDGFNLADVLPPSSFGDFVDLVVPELRRRGRVWDDYEGTTLREHLLGRGQQRVRADHPAARWARSPRPTVGDGAFVSTAELVELLGRSGAHSELRLVDARADLDDPDAADAAYAAAHLPGAVRLDWLRDLSDPDDPVLGQLGPPERIAARLAERGIGPGTTVVAYDDGSGMYTAARAWWSLRQLGFEQVRILDGGLPAWIAAGGAVESGEVSVDPVEPIELHPGGWRATVEDVLAALPGDGAAGDGAAGDESAERVQLVDCRMDSTYDAAGAHVPGATRLPSTRLFDTPTGERLAPTQVRALADAAGIRPDGPTVLYCGGGVSASAVHAVLSDLGYRNLRVYDGSWSEWSADPTRPTEANS